MSAYTSMRAISWTIGSQRRPYWKCRLAAPRSWSDLRDVGERPEQSGGLRLWHSTCRAPASVGHEGGRVELKVGEGSRAPGSRGYRSRQSRRDTGAVGASVGPSATPD